MATTDWYSERCTAIHMLRSGSSHAEVAAELKRSLSWVYKCQARFKQSGWAGLHSQSRAPKRQSRRLSNQERQAIRRVRSALEAEAEAQTGLQYIGPAAVQGRLKESRGAHACSAFTKRNDQEFLHHSMVFWSPSGPRLEKKAVTITRFQPEEREY